MIEWLYCYLPTTEARTPINWREEAEAAADMDFTCHSFDKERFIDGDVDGALEHLPYGGGRTLVYRGWIMKEDEYRALEDGVVARGYTLLTNTNQYLEAALLPNWHPRVADLTPPAAWTWDPDPEEAWEVAKSLGPPPYILKDHVKSCKEAWLEACYVPPKARRAKFLEICQELIDRRGDRFETGIVIRPVVPLVMLAADWTGAPVFDEYRLIFWRGKMILSSGYNDLEGKVEDFSKFARLGERIASDFFVADVARSQSGELILIEFNDGGTAGFPPPIHPIEFYSTVAEMEGGREEEGEPFAELE
jgi:hypothetical protein